MPKIPVTNLYQGISRTQPPHRRNTGYVEDSKNTALDITRGTIKRNGLRRKAALPRNLPALYKIVTIRDARIVIDGTNQTVWAFDENGNVIPVVDQSGAPTDFEYLFGVGVLELDWVVALDTILIVNKAVTVEATTSDNYNVTKTVNVFSELPPNDDPVTQPVEGRYYRVSLRENRDPAGYYRYTSGKYERVSPPNDPECVWDLATMPHRFIYDEANNQITFKTCPFTNRLSGSYNSNLVMPIYQNRIRAIDYFQGRLVLLTNDSVNLSANNDIFRLFVDDVDNIVSQDRISKDILESGIGIPHGTVSIAGSLVILCDAGVMVFDAANGTEMLTTTNGSLRRISDNKIIALKYYSNGNRVAVSDTNNQIRLIGVMDGTLGPQMLGSLNDYDPKTLGNKTITQIFTDEDQVYVLCSDGSLFIHNSTFMNNQYVQLAWSELTTNCRTIKYIDSWDSIIRIASDSSNGTSVTDDFEYFTTFRRDTIDSITIQANVRLDALEEVTAAYDAQTDRTYFTHTNDLASLTHSMAVQVLSPSATETQPKLVYHRPVAINGRVFYVNGRITGKCFVGFTFEMSTTLSNLWIGANEVRLMASRFNVIYQDTSDFVLSIGRKNGRKRRVRFQGSQYNNTKVGSYLPSSGVFTTLLIGDTRYTDITITSTSPANVTLNAVEYTVNGRGR